MVASSELIRLYAQAALGQHTAYRVEVSPDLARLHLIPPGVSASVGYVETFHSRYLTGTITCEDERHLPALVVLRNLTLDLYARTFKAGNMVTRLKGA